MVQKSADYGQNWRFLRVVVQIFADYRHCPIAQRRGEGGILHGRPSPHNMVGEKFLGKVPRLFFHFPHCCNWRAGGGPLHRVPPRSARLVADEPRSASRRCLPTNGFPFLARAAHLYALSSSSGLTTSTPPKTRLCNHLIISLLQRRKNRGVEVARKICRYFHGSFFKLLISK